MITKREWEAFYRTEMITVAMELIAAEALGITQEELFNYYWL